MKTREETARFLENLIDADDIEVKKQKWHFGKVELRQLMDFIYEEPPRNEAENVFKPLRRK